MKIVVCIRQGRDGNINPFDACALEEALKISQAEVIIVSMGVPSTKDFLLGLTRLGVKTAYLLTDKAFAGADTIATAYTLSLAIKKINPDLVFCGRQTLEGDTAQTGPMLAEKIGFNIITNAMKIQCNAENIVCLTRNEGEISQELPCLVTVERINSLRLPSLRSKVREVVAWGKDDISADENKCGLAGSPTRVIESRENKSGKRKCQFISFDELDGIIEKYSKIESNNSEKLINTDKIDKVLCVGNSPVSFAENISNDISIIPLSDVDTIINEITKIKPNVVLWGSDSKSKRLSSVVASRLDLGLCADCTFIETDGKEVYMVRPALSGSVIAKIKSLTIPAMATVRTEDSNVKNVAVCIGYGVKDNIEKVKKFADKYNAQICSTRKAVDNNFMPYETQVGLTGKTISPPVYIAIGVSGAVHHIVGMERSGKVIAINSDKNAPIFEYADFGIVSEF